MTRRLVRVHRVIDEAEEDGLDPDQLFVDPDDVIELEEEQEEESGLPPSGLSDLTTFTTPRSSFTLSCSRLPKQLVELLLNVLLERDQSSGL